MAGELLGDDGIHRTDLHFNGLGSPLDLRFGARQILVTGATGRRADA
ncbi:hypothetical protein GCM10020220_030010 [Nonomuraea rubra]